MRYIVLDLEWNIPQNRRTVPEHILQALPEEIIEIGAVALDADLQFLGEFSQYVRPRVYTQINYRVSEVTRRENDSLRLGNPFADVVEAFNSWCRSLQTTERQTTEDPAFIFCTWSRSDSTPWQKNLDFYGLQSLNHRFLDIQKLYAHLFAEHSVQRSVAYALEQLNIPFADDFHVAVNDARYEASIFAKVVRELQLQGRLPETNAHLYKQLSHYAYDPSLQYRKQFEMQTITHPTELPALLKKERWLCPACEHALKAVGTWQFNKGGLRAMLKTVCADHGECIIKISLYRENQVEFWHKKELLYSRKHLSKKKEGVAAVPLQAKSGVNTKVDKQENGAAVDQAAWQVRADIKLEATL